MKTISGITLKEMIISGSNNLYNHYPEIDALNVFPVPDGDTGMNMNLTMSSGAKEVQNRNDENAYEIAKAFSRGLLMGARGNSGVITSQIFRGFAQSLEGKASIKPTDLADAFMMGKEVAYKAVIRPVEGTILTVIRESAQVLHDTIKSNDTIEKAFEILLKEARASLERTPELLPVLKEVGVVDSGGAGLIVILEGMQRAILGDIVEKSAATVTEEKGGPLFAGLGIKGEEDEEFGYCTEFILRLGPENEKKQFVEKRFTNVLGTHGNSLVVVRDEDIVKVHVHTLNPGSVLSYAQNFGEFVTLKIENMTEQHNHLEVGAGAVSTSKNAHDTSDLELKPLKEYALIAVSAGEGIDNMFKEIGVDYIISGGQTMNPATEDFLEAIQKVRAKNIYIFPNNPNIVMAASQACEVLNNEEILARVIPSKTIPQGLVSAMMLSPELGSEENFREMKAALKTVKSGSVTFAIKDTDIDGVHVTKDYFMGIVDKKIVVCVKDKFEALDSLIDTMLDEESTIITLLLGEDINKEEFDALNKHFEEKYADLDLDIRMGNQPVYSFLVGVE